jgi:hypothetical protein
MLDGELTSPNSFANFNANDQMDLFVHVMSAVLRTADICLPALQVRLANAQKSQRDSLLGRSARLRMR